MSPHVQGFLTEILQQLTHSIPPILYHYTNQTGLLGILKSRNIWLTHTQFLNDTREFRHAVDLVKSEIARQDADHGPQKHSALEQMSRALSSNVESTNILVSSFSENGDLLSQWRAYGGQESSYAIGFSSDRLIRGEHGERSNLVRCIYDADEQAQMVSKMVDACANEILDYNSRRTEGTDEEDADDPDEDLYWRSGGNTASYLHQFAPALKDPSFHEEKEWRIVSRPMMFRDDRFDFRQGKHCLIPFYRYPLSFGSKKGEGPLLREIIVGPTLHSQLAVQSIHGLLRSERIPGFRDIVCQNIRRAISAMVLIATHGR